MGRHLLKIFAALLLAVVILPSCAIWEDRTECPCWLSVDFSKCREFTYLNQSGVPVTIPVDSVQVRCWTDEIEQFRDTVRAPYEDFYEWEVKKGNVNLHYWCGSLYAEEGDAATDLFAGKSDTLYLNCEFARDTANLHKQCMKFTADFDNYTKVLGGTLLVESEYCGFDIGTFKPLKGRYCPLMENDTEDPYVFTTFFYRQAPEAQLKISMTPNGSSTPAWGFYLNELLDEISYDWEKEDLDDVVMKVVGKEIELHVISWEGGEDTVYHIFDSSYGFFEE